jgi:hypothetical protein
VPPAAGPPGAVVQLDRHRRALLVDGDVYQVGLGRIVVSQMKISNMLVNLVCFG